MDDLRREFTTMLSYRSDNAGGDSHAIVLQRHNTNRSAKNLINQTIALGVADRVS